MKNIFIAIMAIIASMTAGVTNAQAQGQGVFLKQVPKIVTGGRFNSSTIAGGSVTPSAVGEKDNSVFPLYTKPDTVTNTEADTVYQQIKGYNNHVYTWVHVNNISGTNTGCTVRLQATADAVTGKGYAGDWKTVQTYTVSATGNPYDVLINASGGNGWHYTNFRWIFTGTGTHSSSWYGGLMIR